jgi:hypothetical protein
MTHVWLDWLVKVAVATAIFALLALAAGLDQAGATAMDAPADRSASWNPAVLLASAPASAVTGSRPLRAWSDHAGRLFGTGRSE